MVPLREARCCWRVKTSKTRLLSLFEWNNYYVLTPSWKLESVRFHCIYPPPHKDRMWYVFVFNVDLPYVCIRTKHENCLVHETTVRWRRVSILRHTLVQWEKCSRSAESSGTRHLSKLLEDKNTIERRKTYKTLVIHSLPRWRDMIQMGSPSYCTWDKTNNYPSLASNVEI